MSIAGKYNKQVVNFSFDIPKEFEFKSLADIYQGVGTKRIIKMFYKNTKGRYGVSFVVATESELLNMPQHLNDLFEQLYNDPEAIEAINNDRLGFTIYQYEATKYNRTSYSINLVDL